MSREWTTPADLRAQVERYWRSGRLLGGDPEFPIELKLRRPESRDLSERFEDVRQWIRELENEPLYRIEWTEIDHRVLGRNRVPARVFVDTQNDAFKLLGRIEDASRFQTLSALTMERLPELTGWLARKPLAVLEHASDWERVLDVLQWFRAHPCSGLYLRQVDIAGVDTKFIEARKSLLIELLELVLQTETPSAEAALPGPRYFERRCGLVTKPVQIRIRLLDQRLAIQGLTDLAIPDRDLAALALPVERVFITENEINGLAFPDVPRSLVIFGLGYGLERLAGIEWLRERALHYWGDIDTYGFHMLDRLRASFPEARSFLMDRETLLEHRAMWVKEVRTYGGALGRLTSDERTVYDELRGVRLEQERIRFKWLQMALGML